MQFQSEPMQFQSEQQAPQPPLSPQASQPPQFAPPYGQQPQPPYGQPAPHEQPYSAAPEQTPPPQGYAQPGYPQTHPGYPQQQPGYPPHMQSGYPPQAQYPPVPAGWQPPPPPGGKIWLGILISIGAPVLAYLLGIALSYTTNGQSNSFFGPLATLFLPALLVLIGAITLTVIHRTRKTGIGMFIGLAAMPIIGFGACVAAIFGVSAASSF